jgi:protein TonB
MALRASLVALALLAGAVLGQGGFGPSQSPVSPPIAIHKVDPEYTEEARNAKIEGTVIVQIVIDENGMPTEPKVVRSLHKGLDENAIEAVKQWRWKPGLRCQAGPSQS